MAEYFGASEWDPRAKTMRIGLLQSGRLAVLKEQFKDDELHLVEENSRVIVVNPQALYNLRQGDALFVVAESEPVSL